MTSRKTINDIEKWVAGQLRVIGRTGSSVLEVKRDVLIPPQLADWQMYTTSGNENDCMIHALLTDCSPTFRTLDINTKNTIASTYRRGDSSSNAPFLQIVLDYYTKNPNIPVNQGGRSANLVGQARIDFLTALITGNQFLRQEFLTPICYYYNINVLIYATNRPGEARRRVIDSKVIFEFEPQPDLIENAPTIVMHNGSSIHFSAMSRKDGITFIMPYADVAAIKYEMDELIKKEQPKATLKCIYKDGEIFYDNSGKQWIIQDITYTSGYGDLNCIALRIQNFETREVLNNVPLNFFQKISNDDLRFDKTAYDTEIQRARGSSSSSNPFTPPPSKPKVPPPLPPASGKTRIPELFTPPAPPKPCPTGKAGGTGFTETLECATAALTAPGTITFFWNQKIIETIDALKAARHTALMLGDSTDPIFDNYPEFKTLELDNTGKVIVPFIDKDRVKDYTSSEAEFNQVMKALKGRIEEIDIFKNYFDRNNLTTNNQLNILTSMLQYPQNSQLENYFLITGFIKNAAQITNLLMDRSKLTGLSTNATNFVALFVLFSRYGLEDGLLKKATSMVTTNKWKQLYSNLFKEFSDTVNETSFNDLSTRVLGVFIEFLNKNQNIITDSFITKLIDGTYMYEIYKNGYENAELLQDDAPINISGREKEVKESKQELKNRKSQFALNRQVIQNRTRSWLKIASIYVRTTPTSFIFDRYTEEEKKFMIQENAICAEISELTGKLGKINVPQMQIPHDFFIKESKENDKLAKFLEESGPNISKDILAERRRMFFEGRGPFVGLSGGKGRKTKRSKHFRIRKKTRNNRKTRCKKHQ